jgi:hypothetical protein
MLEHNAQWTPFTGVICRGDYEQSSYQLMSWVLLVCRDLLMRLVQFYIWWLEPTSYSCINSVLEYECKHLGIEGMKNSSHPVYLALPNSHQRCSIENINMNHKRVFWTLSRHASRLHPPVPIVIVSWHTLISIPLNRVFLCCAIFPLFH